MTDQSFIEFAKRIKAQCRRLDVFENIDLEADAETLNAALEDAVRELEKFTGISKQSADFIGAVEFYGHTRFSYFRA